MGREGAAFCISSAPPLRHARGGGLTKTEAEQGSALHQSSSVLLLAEAAQRHAAASSCLARMRSGGWGTSPRVHLCRVHKSTRASTRGARAHPLHACAHALCADMWRSAAVCMRAHAGHLQRTRRVAGAAGCTPASAGGRCVRARALPRSRLRAGPGHGGPHRAGPCLQHRLLRAHAHGASAQRGDLHGGWMRQCSEAFEQASPPRSRSQSTGTARSGRQRRGRSALS